jgi:hypothetical protein
MPSTAPVARLLFQVYEALDRSSLSLPHGNGSDSGELGSVYMLQLGLQALGKMNSEELGHSS